MAAPARARQGQLQAGLRTRQGEPGLAGWRGQALSLKGEGQHGPAQAGLRKAGGWPRASLAWRQTMSGQQSSVGDENPALRLNDSQTSSCALGVDPLAVRHVPKAIVVAEHDIETGCDLGQPALCPR